MTISLKLHHKVGGRLNLIGTRTFESKRVTIGRGAECDVALDDPRKHISRVHAEFSETGGSYFLTVLSKVNPVLANGQRHGGGDRVPLKPGERFELGEYEVEVLAPEVSAPKSTLLDVLHPSSVSPERAGEIKTEQTVPPVFEPEPAPEITLPPGSAPAPSTVVDFLLDADEPAPAPAPKAAPPTPPPHKAVDVTPTPPLQVQPAPPKDPAPAPAADVFNEATFVGKGAAPDVFEEPTFIGKPPAAPAPPPKAGVFEEATFVGNRQDLAAPAAGKSDPANDRALKAFLEGAQLGPRKIASPEELEQFMRQCGAIVRAATEGVMALLVARAAAKKEFRAQDRTMVASRDNNPLKLMEDPQEAIEFLFDVKERGGGFLGPVQAVGDAFEDMRAHELALIAGMRAAILGALARFDPKTLEPELEKAAGGLGLNRKAKLWEQFVLYQQQLSRDAEDDFNKVFGREFMGTYMEQVKQIRGK